MKPRLADPSLSSGRRPAVTTGPYEHGDLLQRVLLLCIDMLMHLYVCIHRKPPSHLRGQCRRGPALGGSARIIVELKTVE